MNPVPKRALDVVALGGGHGLSATLQALRRITPHITAIVGVSDDGGSSGRLREQFGIVPPGDLRMALAALCGDDNWGSTWARVLQHRFKSDGDLNEHALGNLLITALWEETGDLVEGLEWVAKLLDARGTVLPLCLEPLEIVAQVKNSAGALSEVTGQVRVATTKDEIVSVRLKPENPDVCPQAINAVMHADAVILGPGSWFTSVLTHFEVPEMKKALNQTTAKRILVLNLIPQQGETDNYTPENYLEVLAGQNPDFELDVVIADPRHVANQSRLLEVAADLGAQVELAEVGRTQAPTEQHDPDRLAYTFERVFLNGRNGHGNDRSS
jgi:uncharacterized cofD-like protein